jgi:hypothetical protein
MTFVKHDKGKLKASLVTYQSEEHLQVCLAKGAEKYSVDNWKLAKDGLQTYYDAMHRHLRGIKKYMSTKDPAHLIDVDTKDHHGYHLLANAMFLDWFIEEELNSEA